MTSEKTDNVSAETYLLDNAWQRARERLDLLEAFMDPWTIRRLEGLGVDKGWHCWEVGGGGGSIEAWLCRRVGPSGRVVATDIDPRFLAALKEPNLEVHQSDIAASPVETGTFDLVHSRLLLEHVPDRHAALQHAEWDPRHARRARVRSPDGFELHRGTRADVLCWGILRPSGRLRHPVFVGWRSTRSRATSRPRA